MSSATPVPTAFAMVTRPARYAVSRPGTPSADSGRNASGSTKSSSMPPVDHVHALGAARRAHVDDVVAHEQVLAFDELDAHLLRQERVLEVGAVVGAGRQQHDGRIGDALRRHALQVLEQDVRDTARPARSDDARTARGTAAPSSCGSRACTTRPTARAGCLPARRTGPCRRARRRCPRCAHRCRRAGRCPASPAGTARWSAPARPESFPPSGSPDRGTHRG